MINKGKVLIAAPVHTVLTDGLKEMGFELVVSEKINQSMAYELIGDCVGVVTSTRLQLDRALIDAAPALQFIGRMGSGMEVIDVAYAEARNIQCFSSPEGNSNAVGEHALGLLLGLTKRIAWSRQEVAEGKWLREENRGTELEGKTMGIIGYGHTGRSLVKKLQGFDMKVLVYDKYNQPVAAHGIEVCDTLDTIFRDADVISFHVPIQSDTHHMFNEAFIMQMRKPFIVINTSRGEVVDTEALLQGMQNGRIAGAGLDVFEEEPLEKMSAVKKHSVNQLLRMHNTIITPHIAGYSQEALYKMSHVLLKKIASNLPYTLIF